MKRKIINLVGGLLIIIGLLVVFGSLILNIEQRAMQDVAIAEFKAEMRNNEKPIEVDDKTTDVTHEETEDKNESENVPTPIEGEILCILRIPCIESESPVREGVSQGVLADSLGHEPDTAAVGEVGNCVIAGHRNYSFGKYFNRLDEVNIGDLIYIDTLDETLSYEVTGIKVVEPTDLSVLDQTDEEILTLYTCTPIYIGTHRLVITAKRN